MTEQKENSAVVEESGDVVNTTPQPEVRKPENAEKKNTGGKTSLVLSAVAIAIALAAGIGLYGWGKQQAVNQSTTSDTLANQLIALQKAQDAQKEALETTIKQQAEQLDAAKAQQSEMAKQLDEVQQKVAAISGTDSKT